MLYVVVKQNSFLFLNLPIYELASNECLQEIQNKKKRAYSTPKLQDFESLDFNGNGY